MNEAGARPPALLAERYQLERELGRGAMAIVYRARDLRHDRVVAVKVLSEVFATAVGTERFLREVQLIAALQHPGIVTLIDSGRDGGICYYVMPFVEGQSLRDRLALEGRLSVAEAARIVREVAEALGYAHGRGLVHRDIKPENILLSQGHAMVADFGIARAPVREGRLPLTDDGQVIGTPAYMSPEQASGSATVDGRADVYALGCVLFEMLAGRPPFTGATVESILAQHRTKEPPYLTSLRPEAPDALAAAVARALAKDPARRFARAEDMARHVEEAVSGKPEATLAPGSPVGHFEVVSVLGRGGMGEVYRARDTRLPREVALKILPPELRTPQRLRRFEREARATSALHHPNIVMLLDFELTGPLPFIAMELVEGQTLAALLEEGALPVQKALVLAAQVADALAAAHARGLVHRDLKPANVMVVAGRQVKVLDFGLALWEPPRGGGPHATTYSDPGGGTVPGTILGTPGYMSPEQADGQTVDFRSDQFAFGAVLYEMLSGRRAFLRATPSETLHAVTREEPEPLAALGPRAKAPLQRILRRCLAKSPDDRYGATSDLARDLHDLERDLDQPLEPVDRPDAALGPHPVSRGLGFWLGAATAAAAVVGVLVLGVARSRDPRRAPHAVYKQITFQRGTLWTARFTRDASTVVYSASWGGGPPHAFTMRPPSAESLPLATAPNATVHSISVKDELALAVGSHPANEGVTEGTLARAPLSGGEPREIQEGVSFADWGPDGERLAVVRWAGGKSRLEYPIGTAIHETGGWISHARVSPRGDEVAFLLHPVQIDNAGSVAVAGLDGKVRILSRDWVSILGLAYSADGGEILFTATPDSQARALYAVDHDGRQRVVGRLPGNLTLHDVSRRGDLLLSRETRRIFLVGRGLDGEEKDLSHLDSSLASDISADGRTVLFTEFGEGGGARYSTYLWKAGAVRPVRLGDGWGKSLSPDARWALSIPRREGPGGGRTVESPPLVLHPTASGQERRLPVRPLGEVHWAGFFPDMRRVLVAGNEPGKGVRLYVQPIEGGTARAITPEGIRLFVPGISISPDGTRVAALDQEGMFQIYDVDPPRADGTAFPAAAGLAPIRWSGDPGALFVFRFGEVPARVQRLDVASGRLEPWKEILPAQLTGLLGIPSIQMTPDGSTLVYSYVQVLSELYLVEGLR